MQRAAGAYMAFVAFASATAPCRGDFTEAQYAYATKDHERAIAELQRLAELGHPASQHKLGVMRLRGEGGAADLVTGAAWLMAARDNGWPESSVELAIVLPRLDEAQRASADAQARNFGPEAMRALVPASWSRGQRVFADAAPRIVVESLRPFDHRDVGLSNVDFGWIELLCIVDSSGNVRDALVVEGIPLKIRSAGSVLATRSARFRPARVAGKPATAWVGFNYRFKGYIPLHPEDPNMQNALTGLRAEVRAGNAAAQYEYARLAQFFPELGIPAEDQADSLRRSAESDYPVALYREGTSGRVAPGGAEFRRSMQRAAQAGFGPAQVIVALAAWSGENDPGYVLARRWLEAAVADGYLPARKYLAALLLRADGAAPAAARAQALMRPVIASELYASDPDAWQVQAAVYAAAHEWREAATAQAKAIELADRRRWAGTADLKARLAAYRKRTAGDPELFPLPAQLEIPIPEDTGG